MRSWKEMVTCPYKPEHQVSIDRIQVFQLFYLIFFEVLCNIPSFQKHLVKCSKEHNDSQFEVCLLNASHHIPQQEMASHLRSSSSRAGQYMGKKEAWREGICPRAMRIGRVRLVSSSLTTPSKWR